MKEELLKLLESFETCDNEEFFRYIPYHRYEELAEKLQEYIENKEEKAFEQSRIVKLNIDLDDFCYDLTEDLLKNESNFDGYFYPTFKDYKNGKDTI